MEKPFVILFSILSSLLGWSQTGSSVSMTYKDGRPFDPTVPMMATDTVLFHCGAECLSWSFVLKCHDGQCEAVRLKPGSSTLEFTPDMVEEVNWFNASKLTDRTIGSVIYKGYICYEYKQYGEVLPSLGKIPLLLDLAPRQPKIMSVELFYDDFDPETFFFCGTECKMKVHCIGNPAELSFLHIMGTENDAYQFTYVNSEEVTNNPGNEYLVSTDWEWMQFLTVCARNKFGYSLCSDTILVNDYMIDKEVLDAWNNTTSVSSPKDIPIAMDIHDGLVGFGEIVDDISVYDTSGRLIVSRRHVDSVDLSMLNRQVCIIQIRKEKTFVTKKYYYETISNSYLSCPYAQYFRLSLLSGMPKNKIYFAI
ncbi:MAG: hypothetical protein NC344_04405 [Bacteroidales bacterium]|nr:hypothetical protein [Bacteroidales bacterium]MCM1147068.1 hypothetical protein [Bacteroidales bacterium]MCM1205799.1 hypothetical protein [Bacillota bacterium]MCM1509958.1 hypothetical protein [Clostridium sp.]